MARPDLFSGIRYYVQLNEVDSDKVKALIANLDDHRAIRVSDPTDAKLVFVFPPSRSLFVYLDNTKPQTLDECKQGYNWEWSYDDLCTHLARKIGNVQATHVLRSEWVEDCLKANRYLRGDQWNQREIIVVPSSTRADAKVPLPSSSTKPMASSTSTASILVDARKTQSFSTQSTPNCNTAGPSRTVERLLAPADSASPLGLFETFAQDPNNVRTFHLAISHAQYRKSIQRAIQSHGGVIDPLLEDAQIVIFDTKDNGDAVDQQTLGRVRRWQIPISADWITDSEEMKAVQDFGQYRLKPAVGSGVLTPPASITSDEVTALSSKAADPTQNLAVATSSLVRKDREDGDIELVPKRARTEPELSVSPRDPTSAAIDTEQCRTSLSKSNTSSAPSDTAADLPSHIDKAQDHAHSVIANTDRSTGNTRSSFSPSTSTTANSLAVVPSASSSRATSALSVPGSSSGASTPDGISGSIVTPEFTPLARDANGNLTMRFKKHKNPTLSGDIIARTSPVAGQVRTVAARPRGRPPGPSKLNKTKDRTPKEELLAVIVKKLDDWCKRGCPGSRTGTLAKADDGGRHLNSVFGHHRENILGRLQAMGHDVSHGSPLSGDPRYQPQDKADLLSPHHIGMAKRQGDAEEEKEEEEEQKEDDDGDEEDDEEEDGEEKEGGAFDTSAFSSTSAFPPSQIEIPHGNEQPTLATSVPIRDVTGRLLLKSIRRKEPTASASTTSPVDSMPHDPVPRRPTWVATPEEFDQLVTELSAWCDRGSPGSRTTELRRLDREKGGIIRLGLFQRNRELFLARLGDLGYDVSESSSLGRSRTTWAEIRKSASRSGGTSTGRDVSDERKEGEVDKLEEVKGMEDGEIGENGDGSDASFDPAPIASSSSSQRGDASNAVAERLRWDALERIITELDAWCKEGSPGSRSRPLIKVHRTEGGPELDRLFRTHREFILTRLGHLGHDVSEGSELSGTRRPTQLAARKSAPIEESLATLDEQEGDTDGNRSPGPTPALSPSVERVVIEVVTVLDRWSKRGSIGARRTALRKACGSQRLAGAFDRHREIVLARLKALGHDISEGSRLHGDPRYQPKSRRTIATARPVSLGQSSQTKPQEGDDDDSADEYADTTQAQPAPASASTAQGSIGPVAPIGRKRSNTLTQPHTLDVQFPQYFD